MDADLLLVNLTRAAFDQRDADEFEELGEPR
jgi:hypothetical protein